MRIFASSFCALFWRVKSMYAGAATINRVANLNFKFHRNLLDILSDKKRPRSSSKGGHEPIVALHNWIFSIETFIKS